MSLKIRMFILGFACALAVLIFSIILLIYAHQRAIRKSPVDFSDLHTAKACTNNLYSGRPDDPCWNLSANETATLIGMIQTSPDAEWSLEREPGLGYKGLLVFLPVPNTLAGQSFTEVTLFDGRLAYNKNDKVWTDSYGYFNEPNPNMVYKQDTNRDIETWLLSLGRYSISPDTYKAIRDTWKE